MCKYSRKKIQKTYKKTKKNKLRYCTQQKKSKTSLFQSIFLSSHSLSQVIFTSTQNFRISA